MPANRLLLRALTRSYLVLVFLLALVPLLTGCGGSSALAVTETVPTPTPRPTEVPTNTPVPPPTASPTEAGTATPTPIPISERGFVPVLCYHHIRDWVKSDTEDDRAYIVPLAKFESELQYIKDNGYTTVTAPQVFAYYAEGKPLPPKPIMLSFDDNDINQYDNAVPLLKKYGFTATFFVMTVSFDRENYMTSDDIIQLDKDGFDVEPHTWDHHMVTGYKTDEEWQKQIVGPKKTLEEMLGHPTPFFAYPFGIYSAETAEKIKSYGYKGAFRLGQVIDDNTDPLFAIKRYVANGYWKMSQFEEVIEGKWE